MSLRISFSDELDELHLSGLAEVSDDHAPCDADSVSLGLAREDHIPDHPMIDVLLVHPSVGQSLTAQTELIHAGQVNVIEPDEVRCLWVALVEPLQGLVGDP